MAGALSRGSAGRHAARGDRQGRRHHRTRGGHHAVICGGGRPTVRPEVAKSHPACAACMMWPAQPGPKVGGPERGDPEVSTVLVVDDEERIRTLITRTLTAEGHSVDTAGDGDGALARMAAQGIDLVLLDLVMPRCHGLTVLSSLRQREDPTPVIVLSGVTDIAARVQALDRGAVDVVAKPFSLAE